MTSLRTRYAQRSERTKWLLALTPLWVAIPFALITHIWTH